MGLKLLVQLFASEFDLLELIYKNGLDVDQNKDSGAKLLCQADYAIKLEMALDRPFGASSVREKCNRLEAHGLVVCDNGRFGKKLLRLSPEARQVFEVLGVLAEERK